jgi:hypothetical protein
MPFDLLSAGVLAAPLPPAVPAVPWRVFVAETATGRIVADVPYVGVPSWSYGLNMVGDWQVTVPIGAIPLEELESLLDYWRFSWGISWGNHILQYGPLVTDTYRDQEGPATMRVGGVGMWGLFLTKRLLVDPGFVGRFIADETADTILTGLSQHTIAKRLVENDMTRNGSLPITLPADIAGTEERTFAGYDLAYVGERLAALTQGIDGPEIEMRPEYTDSTRTAVHCVMRIGNTRLGNLGLPHSWDYGRGALTHVDVDSDASRRQNRSWVRGNGMERALLTGWYEEPVPSATDLRLEVVDGGHTSETTQSTLDGWAQANVLTYRRVTRLWSAQVRMDGTNGRNELTGSPSIDLVSAGDTCTMTLAGHRRIPDGTYGRRVLAVRPGDNTDLVRLTLQAVSG